MSTQWNISIDPAQAKGVKRIFCFQKYHDKEAEVARKDGLILIRELAAEVKNMMDIKMNAVMVSRAVSTR
jgi:hypothetical protein